MASNIHVQDCPSKHLRIERKLIMKYEELKKLTRPYLSEVCGGRRVVHATKSSERWGQVVQANRLLRLARSDYYSY